MTVAKVVEEKIDEEIAALDRLDLDEIEALRERRLQQMKKMAEKRNRWISLGHGEYTKIPVEKDFFTTVKASDRVVCHLYRENWPCKSQGVDMSGGSGAAKRAAAMVGELRANFDSGTTRSYEWRITQLNQIVRMMEEKESEIFEALHSDLSKPKFEAYVAEIAKRRGRLLNYMLFLRVTPTLPNTFINMASPIVDVPYHIFILATSIGLIPAAFVTVKAGIALGDLCSVGDLYDFQSIATLFLIGIISITPTMLGKDNEKP